MVRKWEFYTTAMGAIPIRKEIEKHRLNRAELAKLQVIMNRVAEGRARAGDVKALRDGVLEVRVQVANRQIRLAYAEVDDGLVLLALHFFHKQRQVEARLIDTAVDRLKDWQSRHKLQYVIAFRRYCSGSGKEAPLANELFDLIGIDPDEPRVDRAVRDAAEVERLIDTLVSLRTRFGISQAELASEMETTQSAVSKFERAGGDPRISTVQRYAAAIGAHVRLGIDASTCGVPTWQATYAIPAPLESGAETDPGAEIPTRILPRAS